MRQFARFLLLGTVTVALGACHCKTCYVGLPGDICAPCPVPAKPLKPPRPKPRYELPRWPERPVKCVTTQIGRKCCHYECATTCEGYPFKIEVCEITYKSLYTDGSSKIWTEVSRNPVKPSAAGKSFASARANRSWKSTPPVRYSIVGDRCDGDGSSLQAKIQHLDKHVENGVCQLVEHTQAALHHKPGSQAHFDGPARKVPTSIWRRSESN